MKRRKVFGPEPVVYGDEPPPSSGIVATLRERYLHDGYYVVEQDDEGLLVTLLDENQRELVANSIDFVYFEQHLDDHKGATYWPHLDWDAFEDLREELYRNVETGR